MLSEEGGTGHYAVYSIQKIKKEKLLSVLQKKMDWA